MELQYAIEDGARQSCCKSLRRRLNGGSADGADVFFLQVEGQASIIKKVVLIPFGDIITDKVDV